MIPALAYVVMALAGVAVVWGLVTAIADKPPGKAQLLYAAGVWLVTLAQSIIAAVQLSAGFRPESLPTTVGYLIGIVRVDPTWPGSGPTWNAPGSPVSCWPLRRWPWWR